MWVLVFWITAVSCSLNLEVGEDARVMELYIITVGFNTNYLSWDWKLQGSVKTESSWSLILVMQTCDLVQSASPQWHVSLSKIHCKYSDIVNLLCTCMLTPGFTKRSFISEKSMLILKHLLQTGLMWIYNGCSFYYVPKGTQLSFSYKNSCFSVRLILWKKNLNVLAKPLVVLDRR